MKNKILLYSIAVALSGFLFGFDTAVISGADKPIQNLWGLSNIMHGLFIMSMALWGTVLGSLFGGIPCDKLGRKKTLIWIGVLFLVSALGSALAWNPLSFSVFRFIGGLGVGASSVAAPIYISEISPANKRGRLVALYQFMLVFGILIAFISNYFIGTMGANSWRYMLGAEAIPALLYLILILKVPESPRWSLLNNKEAEGIKTLETINPGANINLIVKEIKESANLSGIKQSIFNGKYNRLIILAFLIAFFNQLSGINFLIYYAPRIFEETGLGSSTALLSTAGIGFINLIFTMLGVYLIDRSGRKKLIILGSIGYIVSLSLVSRAFFGASFGGVTIFFFIFIASHAIGQGAVIWVFISEIFPNKVRGNGQAFGTFIHWIFAAIITLVMPTVLEKVSGGPIFAFFTGMMVIQLIWALFYMPETKGKSLETIEKELS